jgi:hypothetical protein
MAAIAAIGIAASAAQLIAYSGGIVAFIAQIYSRVKGVPQQYREYEEQLKLLISTARDIERNPALQLPDVQYHLEATFVDVRALQSILCHPALGSAKSSKTENLWNAIKGSEARRIEVHLERLRQKRAGLHLCISTAHTAQLSNVQDGVEKLIDMSITSQEKYWQGVDEKKQATSFVQEVDVPDIQQRFDFSQWQLAQDYQDNSTALVPANHQRELAIRSYQVETTSAPKMSSHTFGNIEVGKDCTMTMGNIASPIAVSNAYGYSANAAGRGHTYQIITVGQNSRVHTGNTGACGHMRAHDYGKVKVGDNSIIVGGDFDCLSTKEVALGQMRETQRLERPGVTA